MSTNNPQYENSIECYEGEIVIATCGSHVHIRCIKELDGMSVFTHPDQIPELIMQLKAAQEKIMKAM